MANISLSFSQSSNNFSLIPTHIKNYLPLFFIIVFYFGIKMIGPVHDSTNQKS